MAIDSPWQNSVYERVSALLQDNDNVRGLWLSGSLARGDADLDSDVDFVAAVNDRPLTETAAEVEESLAGEFDLVLLRDRGDEGSRLLNLVTFDWKRLDFSLLGPHAIGESKLRGLRRLFDKDSAGNALELPPPRPNRPVPRRSSSP